MATAEFPRPIRASVFDGASEAAAAIDALRRAGFTRGEINVVCSDDADASRFAEYVDQRPAGARTGKALSTAAIIYGILAVVGITIALTLHLVAGFIVLGFCLGLALLTVFGSTMMTRGTERELSDYYDQAVEPGKILVGVELTDRASPQKVADADRILQATSHEPPAAIPRET